MGISAFSVASAVVWFNLAVLLVAALRKKSPFLTRHGGSVLLALFLLGLVRIAFPLDFPFTYVVRSWHILPAIQRFWRFEPLPGLTVGGALLALWLVGGAAVLYRIAARLLREKAHRDGFRPVASPQAERVLSAMGVRNVSVAVAEEVGVPIVTGVLRARIYLPRMALSDAELELILRHEIRHIQSHDMLLKLFYLALRVIFWWNPLVAPFQNELDRLLELRCDAGVVKAFDEEQKRAYLASILAVIKQARAFGDSRPSFAGASALFDKTAPLFLQQRFQSVLAERPKKSTHIAALSGLMAAFLLSYMVIVQPAGKPLGNMADAGVAITPQNAYILVENDIWKLYVDGEDWGVMSMEARRAETMLVLPKFEGGIRK